LESASLGYKGMVERMQPGSVIVDVAVDKAVVSKLAARPAIPIQLTNLWRDPLLRTEYAWLVPDFDLRFDQHRR